MEKYELLKFVDNDFELDVAVSPLDETVWLSLDQIGQLFNRDRSVIGKHIKNIFKENELSESSTRAKYAQVQIEGGRTVEREIELFNLDVIISVGYRVKSKRGIIFRRWATSVLKEYLIKGYSLSSNRALVTNENYIQLINDVNSLKRDVSDIKEIVDKKISNSVIIYEGNFYNGYSFINNLIKEANESVVVIDGYADNSLFDFFIDSKKNIKKTIICHKADRLSKTITKRFEEEYGEIIIKEDKSYHDRFLIIDDEIYLVGTSLNSIGSKTSCIIKCSQLKIKDIISNE